MLREGSWIIHYHPLSSKSRQTGTGGQAHATLWHLPRPETGGNRNVSLVLFPAILCGILSFQLFQKKSLKHPQFVHFFCASQNFPGMPRGEVEVPNLQIKKSFKVHQGLVG